MRREPPPSPGPAGLYLHFPFCSIRCSYCDFPTVAGRDDRIEAYLTALVREIGSLAASEVEPVDTVYLGGGTPSRMEPEQVARVLAAVGRAFPLSPASEITLEGNPESLSSDRLAGWRQAGVTRISIGVQSLDDRVLRRCGRAHDAAAAEAAVGRARGAGYRCVSLDLIAGLPGEDLARWGETVRHAASFGPDHVSVYLIEADKDTPLARSVAAGRAVLADDDLQAESYRASVERLEAAGLRLYEISNFAREGHRSRHNLKYWTDHPYFAFGLGAHAYVRGERRANRRDLDGYLADVAAGRPPVDTVDAWDPERRVAEALVLGLRLAEGVDLNRLGERYGMDLGRRHAPVWDRALAAGLIERHGPRVRLTGEGRLRSNALFAELI